MNSRCIPFSKSSGFTLVEVMVTLMLLGMISALVIPNLGSMYSSVTRRTDLEQFRNDFNAIGNKVRKTDAPYELRSNTVSRFVRVPDGWSVHVDEPVTWRSNGACLGGYIVVTAGDNTVFRERLAAPRCALSSG